MIDESPKLANEGRKLNQTIGSVLLKIGRLSILDYGSGWLKIELRSIPSEICESELLEPQYAKQLRHWLNKRQYGGRQNEKMEEDEGEADTEGVQKTVEKEISPEEARERTEK